jgi:Tfp pilus assembly protein PilO
MKAFDNYLKTADKNQKLMIFVSFIIAIGFLLNYFVPPMLERQSELRSSVDTLQLSLSRNTTSKLKKQLSKKTKELLVAKEKLEVQKGEIDYVMSNVYKIRYAFFNDMRWANTLDNILRFSVQRDLKVSSLKSSDAKDGSISFFKLRKNIKLDGVGRYRDILALIQYIENFETLLEFNKIDMNLVKDGVEFSLEISAYGVGL